MIGHIQRIALRIAMSDTHANPIALVQIREGIAVLSVKAGNSNPLTMDAFGVRGVARHRGLALVNLQQHLLSLIHI